MNVYELLINQIRATNGNLFVSATGKVSQSRESFPGSGEFTMSFDDSEGAGHGFAVGDLIRAQRVDMSTLTGSAGGTSTGTFIYRSDMIVTFIKSLGEITATLDSGTPPSGGFEYVRLGNDGTYTNRQGSLYLTADDLYAPYMDVVDGVDSFEKFNNSESVHVRLGRIDGITDPIFGVIPEHTYGL